MGLFDKKDKKPIAEEKKAKPAAKKEEKAEKPVKDVGAAKVESNIGAGKQGVYGVLISPLISEKSTKEEQHGKYVFAVADGATKSQIAKAVVTRYGVKPAKINVQNRMGKTKRIGRSQGKRKDWRKAIVTLPKGKSINVYEAGK